MKKLYKYYPFNQFSLSAIINGYCWFGTPGMFNDPFDTQIIDSEFLNEINFSKEKILCLSAINDNLLMWAHYADSHKGFCIEYSEYSEEDILNNKRIGIYNDWTPTLDKAKPVDYWTSDRIENYVKDIPNNEKEFRNFFNGLSQENKQKIQDKIHHVSFIKHEDWKYEQEYRIVGTHENNNIFRAPGKITAAYFGMEMTDIDKRTICLILDPKLYKDPLYQDVKFYQMVRPEKTYSLKAVSMIPEIYMSNNDFIKF